MPRQMRAEAQFVTGPILFRALAEARSQLGRVFAFPHAGGSPLVFRELQRELSSQATILAAELPGRGRRWRDTAYTDLAQMTRTAATAIAADPSVTPFVLLGTSFGAHVALGVASTRGGPSPLAGLVVIASPPPHRRRRVPLLHQVSDSALVEQLAALGGLDIGLIQEPEALEFILPPIRADIELYETYPLEQMQPIAAPICSICGIDDPSTSPEIMGEWRQYTSGRFELLALPGDHFVISQNPCPIAAAVRDMLARGQAR